VVENLFRISFDVTYRRVDLTKSNSKCPHLSPLKTVKCEA
jgi:hypothetical protein